MGSEAKLVLRTARRFCAGASSNTIQYILRGAMFPIITIFPIPFTINFLTPTLTIPAHISPPPAFTRGGTDAKKQHIAAKLRLKPGQRVLDIGCGWGGLALALAQVENVHVLGVTLSPAQLAVARQRARQAGLDQQVRFASPIIGRSKVYLIEWSRSACSSMLVRRTTVSSLAVGRTIVGG